MTESPQDKSDSTSTPNPDISTDKKPGTDFWQAARVVGGTLAAGVILIGMAAAKALAGRKPGGP